MQIASRGGFVSVTDRGGGRKGGSGDSGLGLVIIPRETNSGSFTGRQRKRVRGRDCRRRAQIKTPPDPIRNGNCVRSSGPGEPARGCLRGRVVGWLAGQTASPRAPRGTSQSSSPLRARARASRHVSESTGGVSTAPRLNTRIGRCSLRAEMHCQRRPLRRRKRAAAGLENGHHYR